MKFIAFMVSFAALSGLFVFNTVLAAPSENLIIMQLQTEGSTTGTSGEEFILLHNVGEADVNITNWCLQYSSANNGLTFIQISCVEPPDNSTEIWLEAKGYISFASEQFTQTNSSLIADFIFSPKMASTGGHVRLVDSVGDEVDRLGWGNAVSPEGLASIASAKGEVLSRDFLSDHMDTDINLIDFKSSPVLENFVSGLYEKEIIIDVCNNIDSLQINVPEGMLQDDNGDCYTDVCSNLDGLQIEIPKEYVKIGNNCQLKPLENSTILITEILPNAPSYDTGLEFIELYNPNSYVVDLSGYVLQLGPSFTKQHVLDDILIKPGEYLSFSDTETKIILPNSSGFVRLISPAGNAVSQTETYSSPKDNVSWALVEDQWVYTNQVTQGSGNMPYLEPSVDEVLGVTSVLAPCPAGKFRNPETNRCKKVATAVSALKACDADEYRNPETNRCRKIASASSLKECAEGQERNPETNRCRKVAGLVDGQDGLGSVEEFEVESSEGQLNIPIILGLILATAGYIAYEWRFEISHLTRDF